jgi:diguanylate cyclase (GGDEF)-like protein
MANERAPTPARVEAGGRVAGFVRWAPIVLLGLGIAALIAERADLISASVAIALLAAAAPLILWSLGDMVTQRVRALTQERDQLAQRLERVSGRDPLTGLPNRRRLDEEVRRQLAFTQRYGAQMAVLMVDLDGMEDINARHGSVAADEFLLATAEALVTELRMTDIVARIDQDEFVVLLPRTDEEAARIVAGKLIRALRSVKRGRPGGELIELPSPSIGLALSGTAAREDDAAGLLERARTALVAAKDAGGDRFTVAQALALD